MFLKVDTINLDRMLVEQKVLTFVKHAMQINYLLKIVFAGGYIQQV